MKIGLIARCEYARGLAIQSKGFYDNMPVDKVLLVRMPSHTLDCDERLDWYPGATHVAYDHYRHELPQDEVTEWLRGLDVVFTVETTYDWRLPVWARNLGVRTVIQGNPEFYRHDQLELDYAHPDVWWWPTPWRTDRLPPGRLVPVPMPDREWTATTSGRPRFLHVVGKRAFEDRNGTDIVLNAIRCIEEPCDFTIQGFGWELNPADIRSKIPLNSPVNLNIDEVGVNDRWSMYDNQSLLVLPRRYGGLCLPALEAAACGLGVLMPNCSPNDVLASGWLNARDDRKIRLACGHVNVSDVDHVELGRVLTELARNPAEVERMQHVSYAAVPRWSEYRETYMEELVYACQQ